MTCIIVKKKRVKQSTCATVKKPETATTLKVGARGSQQTCKGDNSARDPLLPQGSLTYYMDMREEEEEVVAKDWQSTEIGPAARGD